MCLAPGTSLGLLSHFWLSATLWTIAHEAPLFMGFSGQEYWSGLSCPTPGDLPDSGIEPGLPALQADSLPLSQQGSPGTGLVEDSFSTEVGGGKWFGEDSSIDWFMLLWESNAAADLSGGGAPSNVPMGSGCKYRWSSPTSCWVALFLTRGWGPLL